MTDRYFHRIWYEEYSGSVIECLTWDQGVEGSSLTGGTALCPWARHFILCLVLVQLRKTYPDMTEKMLTGMLRIKSNKKRIWYSNPFPGIHNNDCLFGHMLIYLWSILQTIWTQISASWTCLTWAFVACWFNIGIKHVFLCIIICWIPRVVLKPWAWMGLADVKVSENHVWSLLLHKVILSLENFGNMLRRVDFFFLL